MMTTTEILNEIHRLPTNQQMELKEKLLREKELNGNIKPPITQDEFDRILFDDGFLANLPVETQDKVTPELLREMLAEGIISWIPEG